MQYQVWKLIAVVGAVLLQGTEPGGAEWPLDAVAKVGPQVIVEADLCAAAQSLRGMPWPELGPEARAEVLEAVVAAELGCGCGVLVVAGDQGDQ